MEATAPSPSRFASCATDVPAEVVTRHGDQRNDHNGEQAQLPVHPQHYHERADERESITSELLNVIDEQVAESLDVGGETKDHITGPAVAVDLGKV